MGPYILIEIVSRLDCTPADRGSLSLGLPAKLPEQEQAQMRREIIQRLARAQKTWEQVQRLFAGR